MSDMMKAIYDNTLSGSLLVSLEGAGLLGKRPKHIFLWHVKIVACFMFHFCGTFHGSSSRSFPLLAL